MDDVNKNHFIISHERFWTENEPHQLKNTYSKQAIPECIYVLCIMYTETFALECQTVDEIK